MIFMIPDWVWWGIFLLIVREICAYVFNWSADWFGIGEILSNRKHNRAIEKKWRADGSPIVSTTVGWRRDPWGKQDGYKDNGDGSYSKLLRGGTPEYRAKFAKDVEESSR